MEQNENNTVELGSQEELAFLALEAREHAEALEAVLEYGAAARACWAAGCSTDEVRALINGTAAVN